MDESRCQGGWEFGFVESLRRYGGSALGIARRERVIAHRIGSSGGVGGQLRRDARDGHVLHN
jgi:hypothetical protein